MRPTTRSKVAVAEAQAWILPISRPNSTDWTKKTQISTIISARWTAPKQAHPDYEPIKEGPTLHDPAQPTVEQAQCAVAVASLHHNKALHEVVRVEALSAANLRLGSGNQ